MSTTQAPPIERLIKFKEVANRLAISTRTLERRIDEGILTRPQFNGQGRVYRESMIPTLIDQLLAAAR